MQPMLRIGIDAIQASKSSRGCPPPSVLARIHAKSTVDHLVDEIPLRVEGRSCDEHLFRTESDPERTWRT
jgi:hypothetical protein